MGRSPHLLRAIRLVGAGYLLILAVRGLRTAAPSGPTTALAGIPNRWTLFRAAFVVDVLNPKTGLFFLAFLPQFVEPGRGSALMQFLALGMLTVALACVCDSCWVLLTAATAGTRARSQEHPVVPSRRFGWLNCSAYIGIAVLTVAG